MKTSNKLLLSFVGLIVLLMLISDTVIWANYKRGKNGDTAFTEDGNDKVKKIPIGAFKVLKITGKRDVSQIVSRMEKYEISVWEDTQKKLLYSIQNDTMFINLRDGDRFSLGCPDLQTVILSEDAGVSLNGFDLSSLSIVANKSCNIELINMKVDMLDVKGGEENVFTASGDESRIDSIQLKLGKSSSLRSYDVSYGHVSMSVDSLEELQLTGASLSSMKQIK